MYISEGHYEEKNHTMTIFFEPLNSNYGLVLRQMHSQVEFEALLSIEDDVTMQQILLMQ